MKNLKFILENRLGWFTQRCQPKMGIAKPLEFANNIKCVPVIPNNQIQYEKVKKYQLENFYKEAPIPSVLKLSSPAFPIRNIILREMNMYFGSGNTFYFIKTSFQFLSFHDLNLRMGLGTTM